MMAKYTKIDAVVYRPDSPLYQLQPSFHTRRRNRATWRWRAEKNSTRQLEFMFVSFRLLR